MPAAASPSNYAQTTGLTSFRQALLARHPWLVFVLPLAVFLVGNSFEPAPPKAAANGEAVAAATGILGFTIPYSAYPLAYTIKIGLTVAAMLFVLPGYRRFPCRVGPLAIVVGIVGVGLWVGICRLGLEARVLPAIGLGSLVDLGGRAGFNPLVELADRPPVAFGFLAIRFAGLALVVPVIEEFFLRGFLMRFLVSDRWWEVPFGRTTTTALVVGTVVPMAMHPAELFAAAAWFSLVSWLMIRTRNIWDCVAAHAVTNLLLGVYVVACDQWQLM